MSKGNHGTVQAFLEEVSAVLEAMHATLGRMTEKCDPYIYYQRYVRLEVAATAP